ncbi:MAG: HIT family protein [Acidobacteriaceae bacterium]
MDYLWTPWRYAYIKDSSATGSRLGVPAELAAWPGDRHCVFCNLIGAVDYAESQGMPKAEAERAANIVLRSESCFVCLNAFPYASGHMVVVPYEHQPSLGELAAHTAREMMDLAQRAARALTAVYTPHGMNFGMNLGEAAGAGIAGHLHLHALPRWVGDTNFMTVVGETRVLPESLADSWQKLRDAFARI